MARDVRYVTAERGPCPRVPLRTAGRLRAHIPHPYPAEVQFSHNRLHRVSLHLLPEDPRLQGETAPDQRQQWAGPCASSGKFPAALRGSARKGAAPRTVSSTSRRRCKGRLRAPAHRGPRHKDRRPPGSEGHRLGIRTAPALNKALDGQRSPCYCGQEALGVQAEAVNSDSESARQGTACAAGAPPWASGEPAGQQPPVRVRVGGAATPPPPGHLGLPGQSERSATLSRVLGPGVAT